jgi:ferric-dicitrate binding protein FerR (iron transport regulator)
VAAAEASSSAYARRALSLKALVALEPREAAARLVVRRSEGLTRSEQGVLADWLAADASHREALADAEHVWRVFEEPGDSEILAAMRTHAMAPRPQPGSSWRGAAAATGVMGLVASVLLAGAAGGAWLSRRFQRAVGRLHDPD